MGAEIEVELCGVSDANVHRGSCRNIPALPTLLLLVGTEQSRQTGILVIVTLTFSSYLV